MKNRSVAQFLGWFSVGLGLTEVVAPGFLNRLLGTKSRSLLWRTFGAREMLAGVGLLAGKDPTPWLWSRVAGDAIDLATLAKSHKRQNPRLHSLQAALAAVAAITALDIWSAWQHTQSIEVPYQEPLSPSLVAGVPIEGS